MKKKRTQKERGFFFFFILDGTTQFLYFFYNICNLFSSAKTKKHGGQGENFYPECRSP